MSLYESILAALRTGASHLSADEIEELAQALARRIEGNTDLAAPEALILGKLQPTIQLMLAQDHSSIENAAQYALQVLHFQIAEDPASTIPAEFRNTRTCPYPGLSIFVERRAALFYGRSDDIAALFRRGDQLVTVITGPSGVGKSSFVFAGIVPQLRRRYGDTTRILVFRMTGGADILGELIELLTNRQAAASHTLLESIVARDDALLSYLQGLRLGGTGRVYLILDQFEEVFVGDDAPRAQARRRLLDNLLPIATQTDSGVRVLLSTRENFFEHPDYLDRPALIDLIQHTNFRLQALSAQQLREAIEQPLMVFNHRFGQRLRFQEGLVDLIVQHFQKSAGALPLVQYLLRLLWIEQHHLTHFAYNTLGGVERVLDRHATEIYASFNEQDQPLVKALLVALVRPGLGTEYTRKRAQRDMLLGSGTQREKRQYILQRLSDTRSRIISEQEIADTVYVELTHEILLRQWSFLQELIEVRKERIAEREQLLPTAELWLQSRSAKQPRGESSYLYRGASLRRAQRYIEDRRFEDDVEQSIRICYQASWRWRRRMLTITALSLLIGAALLTAGFLITLNLLTADAEQQRATAQAQQLVEQQRADANETARSLAQQQADANATAQVAAQQQADANGTAQVIAQQHADNNATAQAQEKARADLNATAQVAAQRQADANATAQVAAQGQADANATAQAVARRQADANATAQAVAQQQADENATAQAIAQRQADENATAQALAEQRAADEQRIKLSQRIAADAVRQLSGAPDLALLLAYEAAALDHNPLSEQALRDILDKVPFTPRPLSSQPNVEPVLSPTGGHYLLLKGETTELRDREGNLLATLDGYGSWSPDGQRIAISRDSMTELWDLGGQLVATLEGSYSGIDDQSFSADGQRLLTRIYDTDQAVVWELTGRELARFTGFNTLLSPDGQHIFIVSEEGVAQVLGFQGQQSSIGADYEAAFSRDGSSLLSWGGGDGVHLWDMQGNQLAAFPGESARLSPSGELILTWDENWNVQLWARDGRQLATFAASIDPGSSVEFSPDENYILTSYGASVSSDSPRLWDATGALLATFPGKVASLSPDGQRVLTWNRLGGSWLWDLSGTELAAFEGAWASFSPDGQDIVTWSESSMAQRWSTDTYPMTRIFVGKGEGNHLSLSPDGTLILVTTREGPAQLWDLHGQRRASFEGTSATFSPDGRLILTASEAMGVGLWDTTGGRLLSLPGTLAMFSPDGSGILTAPAQGPARLWDTAGNQRVALSNDSARIASVMFAPGGDLILLSLSGNTTELWKADGTRVASLAGVSPQVSADGQLVITADRQTETLRLWSASGRLISTLNGRNPVFSPDGHAFAVIAEDGAIQLYDRDGRQQVAYTWPADAPNFDQIWFNADGQHILAAGVHLTLIGANGGTASIWRRSGERVVSFDNAAQGVFTPDGAHVLIFSWADGSARLYDFSGQLQVTFRDVNSLVFGAGLPVAFAQHHQRFVAFGGDGIIRHYLLDDADLLAVAACRAERELRADEVARFQLPTPLRFQMSERRCPPSFSWE